MSHLYTSPTGREVIRHSYSSGQTWDKCSFLYQQEKIKGYRRKDKSAALEFGKALESGVQFYHENGLKPDSGVDEFYRLWLHSKDNIELRYTAKEKNWENLRDCGRQLLMLYEILLPSLPIVNPVWQASYVKNVFPGTTLSDLEFGGFIDLVSKAPWVHPLLPRVDIPKGSEYRPVIVDLKTAGVELNVTPALLALDPQLQIYSWISGIPDVGFLWMVKCVVDSFTKGTDITFLEPSGKWLPGDKAVVYKFDEENQTAMVGAQPVLDMIAEAFEEIKGKGSTEKKDLYISGCLMKGQLTIVPKEAITKVKIQFLAVRVSPEDAKEAGEVAARQMVEIHDAQTTGFYPKSGGVRFPNNHCGYCSHRGICTKDSKLVDDLLVQIKTQEEDDWIDEIGSEEE